jgi:hypothetical protein
VTFVMVGLTRPRGWHLPDQGYIEIGAAFQCLL